MSQRSYFRDDPDPGNDRLERKNFAQRTVNALAEVRRQSKSSVAGLIAPWGAGKSTTLAMIVEGLEGHTLVPWTVVDLNPWLYSDAESLQVGFFVALREALPSGKKWSRKREQVGSFFTAISPAGKVNGLAGVDASAALESIGEKIAGDVSANGLKKKAEKVLEELDKPILFVMDDLDRLTPEELLMVFKLVRLVGRLPNVYYLLAYDEKTLLDLIQQTDVASGNRARARDYMEKIIQVRFDVPDLRPKQKSSLVDSAINELLAAYSIELSREDEILFGTAYREYLRHCLTTPRAVNRYFAQVDALYEALNEEVNFIDFALLTFIRTFEPDAYKNLTGSWRDELLGDLTAAYFSFKKETASEKEGRWHKLLSDAHVDTVNVPRLYQILSSLFPRLNPDGGSLPHRRRVQEERGVGNRDYFDRYFNFGVPGDDISDVALSGLLDLVDESADEPALDTIRAALVENTPRTSRKIETRVKGKPSAAAALLPVLADLYADADHEIFSVEGSSRLRMEALATVAITEVSPDRIEEAIDSMAPFPYGAILASAVVHSLRESNHSNTSLIRNNTARILAARMEVLMRTDLATVSTHDFRHVYHWRITAGKEVVDPQLKSALLNGPWTALDFAARSISVATSGSSESLSDLQFDLLDEVIGLDYFYSTLEREIDANDAPALRHHYEDSLENRRIMALSQLKERRYLDRQSANSD